MFRTSTVLVALTSLMPACNPAETTTPGVAVSDNPSGSAAPATPAEAHDVPRTGTTGQADSALRMPGLVVLPADDDQARAQAAATHIGRAQATTDTAGMAEIGILTAARTLTVSPGATPADSGQALRSALSSITDATADAPWLVQVEPGLYDLGATSLVLVPHVTVEGAGTQATVLRSSTTGTQGTVVGVSGAVLRALRVENTGGNGQAIALYSIEAGFRADDVTAVASNGTPWTYGVYFSNATGSFLRIKAFASTTSTTDIVGGFRCTYCAANLMESVAEGEGGQYATGVSTDGGALYLRNANGTARNAQFGYGVYTRAGRVDLNTVEAVATGGGSGFGLFTDGANASVRNSLLLAVGGTVGNYGAYMFGGTDFTVTDINHSVLQGSTATALSELDTMIRIGASQLIGEAPVNAGGSVSCYGAYDENFANLGGITTCP